MQGKIKSLTCEYPKLEEDILPLLKGKVFHVTSLKSFNGIVNDGMIKHNANNDYEFSFGQSRNSYGRRRRCICLFDLRNKSDKLIKDALYRFYFLEHRSIRYCRRGTTIFLILSPKLYPNLIDYTQAQEEEADGEVWIKGVESWYPCNIPLQDIEQIIKVVRTKSFSQWEEAIFEVERKKWGQKGSQVSTFDVGVLKKRVA